MTELSTRRRILAGLGTAGSLALAGCTGGSGDGGGGDDGGGDVGTDTLTPAPVEADETVRVGPDGDLVFAPAELRVEVGATVAWVWDSSGHTLTVQRKPGASDWRGTNLSTKETGYVLTETFDVEGRYDYYCTPHQSAGMSGTLLVGGESPTGTATAAGSPTDETTPTSPSPTDGSGGGGDGSY